MKIRFAGAAQTVTGSQTVISHARGSFLVDCGLYQGPKPLRELNWTEPNYFEQIKHIFITHAHVDHSGLLPRWASWGWQGPVFCTEATADLLPILLLDAARLQEEDARFANRTKHSHHDPALPLYTEEDAQAILKQLRRVEIDRWYELTPEIRYVFRKAGHILGSALIQFSYRSGGSSAGKWKTLTFSGDIGGGHSDLLMNPAMHLETDELVLESTYGDRKINIGAREAGLTDVINRVHRRGGTLVVPAFALGRTQDLLFSIHRLKSLGHIPDIPIYLDSPMANAVTKVYNDHRTELRRGPEGAAIAEALSHDFFEAVETPDESMLLCLSDESKIVISASGMLQGGRVLHHLKAKLPDPKNGVLFVGFQGQETKGRLLQNGIRSLRIHHQEIPVEAEIFTLEGYSAHADADDLIRWIQSFKKRPTRIFLNHGEPEAQLVFADRLRRELQVTVEIPRLHDVYDLEDRRDSALPSSRGQKDP